MHVAIQAAVIYAVSVGLWRVFRRVFARSDLDYVPGPPGESFFKGVLTRLFNVDGWEYHQNLWKTYGSTTKLKGPFGENILYTYDPKAMHHMLVKDQSVFQQSESALQMLKLFFGNALLGTLGDHHKKQRKLLNPVFSINHMRDMIPTFYEITHKLENSLFNQVKNEPKEIDMVFWMGRTALELIGQSGFGHSFDDLSEEYNEHCYSSALKLLVPTSFSLVLLRTYFLKPALKIGTPAFRHWAITYLPIPALRKLRDLVDELHQTSLSIYQGKKQALMEGEEKVREQVGRGKDILSILMKQNMEADDEDRLDEDEIYGQISTFTFAGMDTTSNALSRTLWLLAQYPEAQSKLRVEIREARMKADGDVPYDELVSLPFLDAVCRETLRLYAPISQMIRQPIHDIVLPLSNPITLTSGEKTSEIMVPKGTKCILSLMGSNRNVEIWGDDADEWKPERWMGTMRDEVVGAKIPGIYSHLMTFGAGGRACIGFKFSQLEMKAVLATLISRFEFSLANEEISWQMTGVTIPVLASGDRSKPCMPLRVKVAA
ncbi:cytochrome P450 [Panaeolus papilionaceus]|nr:cytochrome P450 [Panaeolus papilionaceus]